MMRNAEHNELLTGIINIQRQENVFASPTAFSDKVIHNRPGLRPPPKYGRLSHYLFDLVEDFLLKPYIKLFQVGDGVTRQS